MKTYIKILKNRYESIRDENNQIIRRTVAEYNYAKGQMAAIWEIIKELEAILK